MSIQVLHSTNPIARKPHLCDSCGRRIEPGETYNRQDNVGDDGRYTWKSCSQCLAVWDWMWATDPDLRYYDDGVDMHEWLIAYGRPELLAAFLAHWRAPDGSLITPELPPATEPTVSP